MKLTVYDKFEELADKLYIKTHFSLEGKPNFKIDTLEIVIREAIYKVYSRINNDSNYFSTISKLKENRDMFLNQKFCEVIDDIKFISKDEESLAKLVNYYEICKQKASKNDKAMELLKNIKGKNCIVTDISLKPYGSSAYASYIDERFPSYVYFNEEEIKNADLDIFLHEIGHFYDKSKNYVAINNLVKGLQLDENLITDYVTRMKNSTDELYDLIQKQIVDSEKIDELIKNDHQNTDKFESPFFDKVEKTHLAIDVYNGILTKEGISPVCDIIQAVCSMRNIEYDDGFTFHSKQYYKNRASAAAEIFANFATLYTSGQDKKLDEIFPKEFREKLTIMYVDTVLGKDNQNRIINGKNSVSSRH